MVNAFGLFRHIFVITKSKSWRLSLSLSFYFKDKNQSRYSFSAGVYLKNRSIFNELTTSVGDNSFTKLWALICLWEWLELTCLSFYDCKIKCGIDLLVFFNIMSLYLETCLRNLNVMFLKSFNVLDLVEVR